MLITHCEVTPVNLKLGHPVAIGPSSPIQTVTAIFIRLETRDGRNAWGCAVAHPQLTGEQPAQAIKVCQHTAERARDLNPTNLEYALAELAQAAQGSPAARCAFDLAFYDLFCLAAGMPLYRMLGGYRNRIQTSATIPDCPVNETVETAQKHARSGFRMLKIKGGRDPQADVERVKALHRAFPDHILRLDADGQYTVQQSVDVAEACAGILEMLEQPTPPADLEALGQVTRRSKIPILADESVCSPAAALQLAAGHYATGICVKVAACGGLHDARQVDSIARAARLATMVGCLIEPALLISAGLSLALSSPNVQFADLDGYLDIEQDPSTASFRMEDGWLVASEIPGLGCSVDI